MKRSRRLTAIAELVDKGNVLADIGTDHGYLPIWLVQRGTVKRAIAMDIRREPLKRAEENIKLYGLESYIETRLSDGAQSLKPGEARILVAAGMGGPLMEKIIIQGAEVFRKAEQLILQPQSDIGHFRRFLDEQGYVIVKEDMTEEDGKYYPMMKAVPGAEPISGSVCKQQEIYYRYGELLLKDKHPVLGRYLQKEQIQLENLIHTLEKSSGARAGRRLEELQRERQLCQAAENFYEKM